MTWPSQGEWIILITIWSLACAFVVGAYSVVCYRDLRNQEVATTTGKEQVV